MNEALPEKEEREAGKLAGRIAMIPSLHERRYELARVSEHLRKRVEQILPGVFFREQQRRKANERKR
jgi:hypothetical protein